MYLVCIVALYMYIHVCMDAGIEEYMFNAHTHTHAHTHTRTHTHIHTNTHTHTQS